MKNKFLSILMVFTILCSFSAINAGASSDLGFYPLNYEYYFSTNDFGTRILNITVMNNTDKAVLAYEFTILLKDIFGRPIYKYGYGSDYMTLTYSESDMHYKYDYEEIYWSALGYDKAYAGNSSLVLETVIFADGSVWENNENCYEEANFSIINDRFANGTYKVDGEKRQLALVCTGCSVWACDWYIWDDNSGWKWFDSSLIPYCEVWADSATIKLVVNKNPNLYKIISFSVAEQPEFIMSVPNSYSADYMSYNLYDSNYNNEDVIIVKNGKIPYTVSLWDKSTSAESRAWYIWDDERGWVWFSDEKGPSCDLWSEGSKAIKLVHNNNPELYTIFAFTITPEQITFSPGYGQQGTYI